MIVRLKTTIRSSMANALLAALDAADGPAKFRFYTGAIPASVATAVTTQTLLGTLLCSDPAGAISNGELIFDVVTQDSSADASGTATWARLFDGADVAQADFDVTDTAGNGAVKINTTTIVVGGPILVASAKLIIGGA